MCVYEDIHIWKQHLKSPPPVPEPSLVIPRVEPPRPVEVDSRTGLNAVHGDQTKRWRLQRFATLQGIGQRPGNEGAYADASGFGCPAHLLRELVVKRDCGPHDVEHNKSSSTHNTIEHPDTVSVSLTLARYPERTRNSGQLVLRSQLERKPIRPPCPELHPSPCPLVSSPLPVRPLSPYSSTGRFPQVPIEPSTIRLA